MINNFDNFQYKNNLKTTGAGVNFKFGLIFRPVDWIRIGGAKPNKKLTLQLSSISRLRLSCGGIRTQQDFPPGMVRPLNGLAGKTQRSRVG